MLIIRIIEILLISQLIINGKTMNKVFDPLIFAITISISAWVLGSAWKKTASITVKLEYAVN